VHLVEFFLFQRGEEALHPRVVITAARSAHALDGTVPGQGVAKSGAGELTAPVAVKNHTVGRL